MPDTGSEEQGQTRGLLERGAKARESDGWVLQFSGQAASYLQELRALDSEGLRFAAFFDRLFATLGEECDRADFSQREMLPDPTRLRAWLEGGQPEERVLAGALVSGPLIFATQVGNFLRFADRVGSSEAVLARARAVVGHSQGINAALLVACGLSGEDFLEAFSQHLRFLLRSALRSYEVGRGYAIPETLMREERAATGADPAPMASVRDLSRENLDVLLAEFHELHPRTAALVVGLHNGPRSHVVCGPAMSLARFRRFAEGRCRFQYLPVSLPFHSPYLEAAAPRLLEDLHEIGLELSGADLRLPVIGNRDGDNLQERGDLCPYLAQASTVEKLDWERVIAGLPLQQAAYLLSFGPGEALDRVTASLLAPSGVPIVRLITATDVATFLHRPPRPGRPWADFAPRRARLPDGREILWNEFSRFTGLPPIFGGGMTPTTVEPDLSIAAANAGYLVEWAGGGQVTEEILRGRLEDFRAQLHPGQGIVLNLLYLDAYLWNFQYPLVHRLRREGVPIIGVTVSAGIPDRDEAVRILDELEASGVFFNSFKPGTAKQIEAVLEIARVRPERKLIMQVEGGAAGGHHSREDLRALIREHYAAVRRVPNVILAVGGGVATPEDARHWLFGTWNEQAQMPVDAVFLGTRLMAAREACTAPAIKEALTRLRGRFDHEAESSVTGVVSGRSGLGADIHYADNHWSRLSQELDDLVRGRSPEEARNLLHRRRGTIVRALNRTAKPYFGTLARMTYAQVLERFVSLVCPGDRLRPARGDWPDAPFIDRSFRSRFVELMARFENRFAPAEKAGAELIVPTSAAAGDPQGALQRFAERYPAAATTYMVPEDERFFLEVCRRPGKPVNFIPQLDEDILKWYRSDSLWYAHAANVDPQSCAWIPGPVAVRGIARANEPVAEILSDFVSHSLSFAKPTEEPVVCAELRRVTGSERNEAPALQVLRRAPYLTREGALLPNTLSPLLDGAERSRLSVAEADGGVLLGCVFREPGGSWERRFERRFVSAAQLHAPLRENTESGVHSVRALYRAAWLSGLGRANPPADYDGNGHRPDAGGRPARGGREVRLRLAVSGPDVARFSGALGGTLETEGFPREAGILYFWPALATLLLDEELDIDPLQLVHQSHSYHYEPGFESLKPGLELEATARAARLEVQPGGCTLVTQGELLHEGRVALRYTSSFFVRGWKGRAASLVGAGDATGGGSEPSLTGALARDGSTSREAGAWVSRERPLRLYEGRFRAPADMSAYSVASGDRNPLHTDALFARQGGHSGPIVHGMWLAGRCIGAVLDAACRGKSERLGDFSCDFLLPVLPGEELRLWIDEVANRDANSRLRVSLLNAIGDTVCSAMAEVSCEPTAYVFTGQGSQEKGMGQELFAESAAARSVWEQAEQFTRERFSFSILRIVRENPTLLRIGNETLRHPDGVLQLTQFTQVALLVYAMASRAALAERGLFAPALLFAGHSLGEYAALAAHGILNLEGAIELVYRRGLAMQAVIRRDEGGRSGYGMTAILLSRPDVFGIRELEEEVRAIVAERNAPLEVVNYNVREGQYGVAGRVEALELLEERLGRLPSEILRTVRLVVDIPFHSSVLGSAVADFRRTIEGLLPEDAPYETLLGRFVPNLLGTPLEWNSSFVDRFAESCDSPEQSTLRRLVGQEPTRAGIRLFVRELLAFQFARPVRWDRTQETLLEGERIERIVEIGPKPHLSGMLRTTLTRSHSARTLFPVHFVDELRRTGAEPEAAVPPAGVPEAPPASAPPPLPAAAPAASPGGPASAGAASAPAGTGGGRGRAGPLSDVALSAVDSLRTVLALKAVLRPEEISDADTIDALFNGNSSRRNQALADLGAEFATNVFEGAYEEPIGALSQKLRGAVRYARPGVFLTAALEELAAEFLPPDFGLKALGEYLSTARGLPPGHVQSLLLRLVLLRRAGPSHRSGELSSIPLTARLPNASAARDWVDRALQLYATERGLDLGGPAGQSEGAGIDRASIVEIEEQLVGEGGPFDRWLRRGNAFLGGRDPHGELRVPPATGEGASSSGALVAARAPEERSLFQEKRVVHLRNSLQWTKRNLFAEYWELEGRSRESFSVDVIRQIASFGSELEGTLGALERGAWGGRAETTVRNRVAQALRAVRAVPPGGVPVAGHASRPGLEWPEGRPAVSRENPSKDFGDFVSGFVKAGVQGFGPRASTDGGVTFAPDASLHNRYVETIESLARHALDLRGRVVLVTGAGPGSIALSMVAQLLCSGARVVVTTSSYSPQRLDSYRDLFARYGVRGSELIVAPFSQGSREDVRALVAYLFERGLFVDCLVPFGGLMQEATLPDLDESALSVLRVMLLGVHWLIAELAASYERHLLSERMLDVLLPLSPNHGDFGGDGLYAEAKLGLEALLRKRGSEAKEWGHRVQILGCRIGWVRGTGLMAGNDVVAPLLEERTGVRTFHTTEMALMLTALAAAGLKPPGGVLDVNLSGGLDRLVDLKGAATAIRKELSAPRAAVSSSARAPEGITRGTAAGTSTPVIEPMARIRSPFPEPSPESERATPDLSGLDLASIVCVVGFGEVGPGGSARTRWEIEQQGELSVEGVLELAWTMGLVRWDTVAGRQGWVEGESGEPITEWEIYRRFEKEVRSRTGIRAVNAELQGFDPLHFPVFAEVLLEEDFYIPARDEEEARAFCEAVPEGTQQYHDPATGRWFVRRAKGTTIRVMKSMKLTRFTAGQIPDGWDAERYGLSRELVAQVDRVTLFNLVATAEAFAMAGIEPFDLYRYLHPSDVGTTSGTGMGGLWKNKSLLADLELGRRRQEDVLQEALFNVTAAWTVTSYLGSTGAIQTPVAACATAGVSVDMALNLLATGRSAFVVTGAFDDLTLESMAGFAEMKATASTEEMGAAGIPHERMCRPNDARRGGFVEAQGGGTLLLTRGDIALRMGLPVYGIVAYSGTHSDGIASSIPAPGLGLASAARGIGAALSRFGLSADDIALVSKHDTSTRANDVNENRLHQGIARALGRTPGEPLFVISQKSLTGHSKGGAAAWQLAGVLQAMQSGVLPGNRNLEDVDQVMNEFSDLVFSNRPMRVGKGRILAGLVSTLGFGHVGAMCLILSGDLFFAALDDRRKRAYLRRRSVRERHAIRRLRAMRLPGERPLFSRRTTNPIASGEELSVLTSDSARIDLRRGRLSC